MTIQPRDGERPYGRRGGGMKWVMVVVLAIGIVSLIAWWVNNNTTTASRPANSNVGSASESAPPPGDPNAPLPGNPSRP